MNLDNFLHAMTNGFRSLLPRHTEYI